MWKREVVTTKRNVKYNLGLNDKHYKSNVYMIEGLTSKKGNFHEVSLTSDKISKIWVSDLRNSFSN